MLRSKSMMPATFEQYLNGQSYYEQMWTGASITLMFAVAVCIYAYCSNDQNVDRMFWRIERFIVRWNLFKPRVKEGFETFDGAEAVRIGLDLSDPESPKEKSMLGPQVWHPRRITPIRRHITRTTSAPVFTVPLSPSDEPKKIW